jgi:exosortase
MAANPKTVPATERITFDGPARMQAAVLGVLFVIAFWELLDFTPPNLGGLAYAWLHKADWSHGPLIPLFSAYLVYLKWDQIRRCPVRYTWPGLVILLGAFMVYALSLAGVLAFAYLRPFSMLVALLGVIVMLNGVPVLRYAWLPWLYLFFAIPLPQRIYFMLTDPLRRLAASVASAVLSIFPNLELERTGSNLVYMYEGRIGKLGVADACSGMRSTVTLCAVGVAVAFMSERPLWQRIVLVLACVPIATFCNLIRVIVTCLLHVFVDPKYTTGNYHMMLGLAVIGLAFAMFSGLAWAMNHLFVEVVEDEPETAA